MKICMECGQSLPSPVFSVGDKVRIVGDTTVYIVVGTPLTSTGKYWGVSFRSGQQVPLQVHRLEHVHGVLFVGRDPQPQPVHDDETTY